MNLSVKDSIALAEEYRDLFKKAKAEIVACPSFTSLPFVCKALEDSKVGVGAQDMFWEERGAYTGQTSGADFHELGAEYVIIGHSERREFAMEEDWMIRRKMEAAFKMRLKPILCVGETAADREAGDLEEVLSRQIGEALDGLSLSLGQNLLVAYEPVWAIGSGATPEAEDIAYVTDVIRVLLRRFLGERSDRSCAVLYGGSVNEETIKKIMETGVDGFLVGGASLKAREFYRLAERVIK